MTINTKVQMVGVKDTVKALSKIDKSVRREFTKDAKSVVRPIIDDATSQYPDQALSGMARRWKHRGRDLFPYDRSSAVRGLKLKIDTSRRAGAVIKLVQTNPAAVIFELAGKASVNRLGDSLTRKYRAASRLLWPITERRLPDVQDEMQKLVLAAMHRVQQEIR